MDTPKRGNPVKRKEWTFSKKLLIFDYAMAVALVIVAVVYGFLHESYSNPISGMVDCWIGQAAVASAFYFWKAKCENRAKYAQEWYERMCRDVKWTPEQIDTAARFTEMITKD